MVSGDGVEGAESIHHAAGSEKVYSKDLPDQTNGPSPTVLSARASLCLKQPPPFGLWPGSPPTEVLVTPVHNRVDT